jgi:hypothetical protein
MGKRRVCEKDGCNNPVDLGRRKYCSKTCRNYMNIKAYWDRKIRRADTMLSSRTKENK